jgi:hypothetical protein
MEHVLDTLLTDHEVHHATVLAWYLDTFNAPYLLLIFSILIINAATILKMITSCPFFFNAVMFLIPKQLLRSSLCSKGFTFHAPLFIQDSV